MSLFLVLIFGKTPKITSEDYSITNELISRGPRSFIQKSTAIKIGRAVFVPFILLSHIYDLNTKIKK